MRATGGEYDPEIARANRDTARQKRLQAYADYTGARLSDFQVVSIDAEELLKYMVKKTLDSITQALMTGANNIHCVVEASVANEVKKHLSAEELRMVKFNVGH